MEIKRVILIATLPLDRNTRGSKEARALTREGYLVTSLCWHKRLKIPRVEQWEVGNYPREIRLGLKAPAGNKVLLFYPIWWCFAFFWLMVTRWDIAHAINFDSIPPTVIAGRLKRKPVIYEITDTYEDSISLPKVIRNLCIKIDKLFMRLARGIILVDEMQIEELGGNPNSKVITAYDSPSDIFGRPDMSHRRNNTFTLFFSGMLFSERALNLDKFFAAIRSIEDVRVVIAGLGNLVEEITEWSRQMPEKIQFIGAISHTELLQRSVEADLLFMLRSPVLLANKYICGSKLLEAMMCGKPILVNKGTSTASKVYRENCGLVVDANNIEELKSAIIRLKDNPELCQELGRNARKAYEQKYGWHIMEQRLLNLYSELTEKV